MKGALAILFLLVFIEIVSAQSIELNYPDEVSVNEEFEVELRLIDFDAVSYDVKIDITKDEQRVSRILVDDLWKSTFYYVKDAITEEHGFILKISKECEGELDMVVRIRKSGGSTSEVFGGYGIDAIESSVRPESSTKEEVKKESVKFKENIKEDSVLVQDAIIEEQPNDAIKIDFGESKDIKSESSTNFYKNLFALSGIIGISIFLGMVYIIKQGKYKNEFG